VIGLLYNLRILSSTPFLVDRKSGSFCSFKHDYNEENTLRGTALSLNGRLLYLSDMVHLLQSFGLVYATQSLS